MGDARMKTASSAIMERSIDAPRPLRVVVIGAGISGILACIRFRQRVKNLELQVYEKNVEVGGTWFENRYPGCACDIPAHTYQASFEPNKEWSQFYASAKEIHRYWKHVAAKYGCMKYIKLSHQVLSASWDDATSQWALQVNDKDRDETFQDSCDVLISATGALNEWKWPEIPGLQDFQGKLLHSANWDETYDWEGKRIAVIGNGSSGIQIVPAVLPKSSHVDHYIRGRTWLSPTFAREKVDQMGKGLDNFSFTPEDIHRFKTDPNAYQKFRKDIELELQSVHEITIRGSAMQLGAVGVFTENMKKRLAAKPHLADQLMPSFPPVCRRLTPGPGYLEALTDAKCDIITSPIAHVDKTGIVTEDGQHRPVDAIVCATGFNTTFTPRFPLIGKNGASLAERWADGPDSYISVAVDSFPNYFMALGPNAALGTGNLLFLIECEIDYFTRCVVKMQRENILAMAPRPSAVQGFAQYCSAYFDRTVFTMDCSSWYKGGKSEGRVVALWPGSSLHARETFLYPRWEDYEYEYGDHNPTGWLGDGWTEAERQRQVRVDYLDDDQVDFPPVSMGDEK